MEQNVNMRLSSSEYVLDPTLQYLIFEGHRWTYTDLALIRHQVSLEKEGIRKAFWEFLRDWFSDGPTMEVQSSGSTGQPKRYAVGKEQMMNSACRTCRALGLKTGDRILLCMDLRYIGAKMMIVRALVAGLEVVLQEPSAHPLARLEQSVDFLSVVPLQLFHSLQIPEERRRLEQIRLVLVGGGSVDKKLWQAVRNLSCRVYSSYGMTETLSHVALCDLQDEAQIQIGKGDDFHLLYTPLPGVGVRQSEDGCLMLDVPDVCAGTLETNDLVELRSDGSFIVLGRKDNVVNSGGVKIHLEEDEAVLSRILDDQCFALTAVADPALGEALVLLIVAPQQETENLIGVLKQCLPRYHVPRYIFPVSEIPVAGSGKIARATCRALAEQELNKHRSA